MDYQQNGFPEEYPPVPLEEEPKPEPPVFGVPQPVPVMHYVTYIPPGFTPKTYEERKSVRKDALTIGLGLIFVMLFTQLWSFIALFVGTAMGFSQNDIFSFLQNEAIQQVVQVVYSILICVVIFGGFYKIRKGVSAM